MIRRAGAMRRDEGDQFLIRMSDGSKARIFSISLQASLILPARCCQKAAASV